MIRHYLVTAVRILFRNKFYAIVNLFGLTLGCTFGFILLIYVMNAHSYDRMHVKSSRIYRVTEHLLDAGWTQPRAPFVMVQTLKNEYPAIEKIVASRRFGYVYYEKSNQKIPLNLIGSSNDLFDIFDFKILEGQKQSFLVDPNDIILSKSTAEIFFHGEKALGQTLKLNVNGKEEIFTIKGIFEDLPWNSSVQYKAIGHISWALKDINASFKNEHAETSWILDFFPIYLLMKEGASPKHLVEDMKKLEIKVPKHLNFGLQTMQDFYLGSSNLANVNTKQGNLKMVQLMLIISILILLIASINYILLSSARTMTRYKEIAVRLVAGARARSIRRQFLSESILLCLIAFCFSILLVINLIPAVNTTFNQDLHFGMRENLNYVLLFLIVTIIVGLISGSYVAFYYSRLTPAMAFSHIGGLGYGRSNLWKVLLSIQLILFVGLMLVTSSIREQIRYMKTSDLGFDSKNLVLVYLDNNEKAQYHAILDELTKEPSVVSASGGFGLPPTNGRGIMMVKSLSDPTLDVKVEGLSFDFEGIDVYGMTMVSGRNFSRNLSSDSVKSRILNETAAKALGIKYTRDSIFGDSRYIGIVKDFFIHSKHEKISPLMIDICRQEFLEEIVIRCRPEAQSIVIASLDKLWKKFFRESKPNCILFENAIGNLYTDEDDLVKLLTVFNWLIIIIAVIGLFSFSLFIMQKRTKEIGIRKVNGATALNIFRSMSWEFLSLVLLTMVISWPVGWYIIHKWQQNFAYHEIPGILVFLKCGILAVLVVQLTVFIHILKASRTNPVSSLRYE